MEDKTRQSLVSILMAAYNAEKTIGFSIESVLAQTYKNWELLIINDCSTDNTLTIAESYADSRIHIYSNEINSGVSLSRKRGLDAASGEWIAILDSDDLWTPDKLEKQIAVVKSRNAELVYTGSAFIKADGTPIDWQLHVPDTLTYRKLLKQNLISNSSALVRKDLYREHYVIGDNMHEDFAVWLGITIDGRIAYGIDEPLLIYRLSESSKSSNKINAAKMNWKTYRYCRLSILESFYYMMCYCFNGIAKYHAIIQSK